jgi:hypothetical protein
MNENDMDRYYWRTGERWGGDERSESEVRGPIVKLRRWTILLMAASFVATTAALLIHQ